MLCQVIAAAQAGKHSEKRESYGDTLIIDPWGTIVGRLPGKNFSFQSGFFYFILFLIFFNDFSSYKILNLLFL